MTSHSVTSRWLALSVGAWLFVRALAWLIATDIALRVLGFRQVLQRLEAPSGGQRTEPSSDEVRRARRYARWIQRASRLHIHARCLHRSLVLHGWLRREGLMSELEIGVRKDEGQLKAHAWVVLGRYIVNDKRAAVAAFTSLSPMVASRQVESGSTFSGTAINRASRELQWQ
jgi:hypothetical protein